MPQLLALSRAARLVGVPRGALQKRIQEGRLHSYEGMISTEELLEAYPEAKLEDAGLLEKTTEIKQEAFGRRVRDRMLPSKEVLAERLFEQSRELADVKTHLKRYHSLVINLQARLEEMGRHATEAERPLLTNLDSWIEQQLETVLVTQAPSALAVMDDMLRVMSAHITLKPSRHDFFVEGTDTLLEAALKSGVALNYGCSNGNCGLCKARVVDGQVLRTRHHDYVLSEAEKQQGYCLMCSYTAVSDLTLEALEANSAKDIPAQELSARVKAIAPLGPDMMLLHLQTPRTHRLRFLAGQTVTLGLPGAGSAEFPITTCPCDDRNLQFHVERGQGGTFGEKVFGGMTTFENVSVYGPWGDYDYKEDSQHATLFLAFGRGFGLIKSLIEHTMARETAEDMLLVWAGYPPNGHYMANLCRAWTDALDNFRFDPINIAGQDPQHEAVQVVDSLLVDHPESRTYDIYLAGPDTYVGPAADELRAAGIADRQIVALAV
ncbi:MAG: 2Fe-2S iron-sulfur cluster-binding protein [Thiobacillaceae bacterium]